MKRHLKTSAYGDKASTTLSDYITVTKPIPNLRKERSLRRKRKTGEVVSVGADINGDFGLDESRFVAKVVQDGQITEHFVKFGTFGPEKGRMVNPHDMYFNPANLYLREASLGENRYEFKRVSEGIYDTYVGFLQTKNQSLYFRAERMMNDAYTANS